MHAFVVVAAPFVHLQFRSYLVRSGDSSPKYGVEDIYDALSSAAVINIHAYGESGDAQLEVPIG